MGKYFNKLKSELAHKSRDEIIEALDVAYQLLDDRDRLFEVIPECPEHGPKCTPHAIEWIKSNKLGRVSNAKFNITGNFDGNTYAEMILLPGYIYRTSKIIKIEITSLKEIEPGMIVPKEGHGLLEIYIHKLDEPLEQPSVVLQHNAAGTEKSTNILVESGNAITLKMSDMDLRLFRVDLTLEAIL